MPFWRYMVLLVLVGAALVTFGAFVESPWRVVVAFVTGFLVSLIVHPYVKYPSRSEADK